MSDICVRNEVRFFARHNKSVKSQLLHNAIELPEFSCLFFKTPRVRELVGSRGLYNFGQRNPGIITRAQDYTSDTWCSVYFLRVQMTLFLARIVLWYDVSEVWSLTLFRQRKTDRQHKCRHA